jgi:hypothetical protein
MDKDKKEISRRNFLELVAVGAAGAAVTGLSIPSALSAPAKSAAP